MSEAHFDQMFLLVGFAGILFFLIVGVILFSNFRKNKSLNKDQQINAVSTPLEKQDQVSELAPNLMSEKPELVAAQGIDEVNLEAALKKTEENFFGRIRKVFSNSDKQKCLEEIEEILYTSDLGTETVQKLLDAVEKELSKSEMSNINLIKVALEEKMFEILKPIHQEDKYINRVGSKPTVIMIVGVNGAGKTTSIGKISAQFAAEGKKVLVAAGDTFRAAAGGQLKTWTDRAQVEIYWPENTTDPSAVAFDALTKAKSQDFDYLILDTAGRLHTQSHLMEELKKVKRVMTKVISDAPHEVWIVLDANSGQNALLQAKEFNVALGLTGVVLTKMDGTAKGGVALAVVDQVNIPIKLVGIGEKIHHLKRFDYQEYVRSILGSAI